MTKYETVIKVLSQVDRETLEMMGKGFFKAYNHSQYLRYGNLRDVFYSFIKYFSHTVARVVNVSKNGSTYSIFGNTIETCELERVSYSNIEWNNENEENFNREMLSIFNQLECCHCDDCHMCCYINIFFIEGFYDYCLEQNFIKVLIKEMNDKENNKIEKKEEENMDNLRTISTNLVDYFYKYEEIISDLRDIGVKDEKICDIFYEILKDISK